MKLYISGPMTGYDNDNIRAFSECAKNILHYYKFRSNPLFTEIVVPHEVTKDMPKDSSWQEFLKADIKALVDCDAIMMMEGWADSKGARLELHIALELGMKVYIYDKYNVGWRCMNRGEK